MSWIRDISYKGIDFELFGDWEAPEGLKVCVLVGQKETVKALQEQSETMIEALQYFADHVEEFMLAGWAGDFVYWRNLGYEDEVEVERIANIVLNSEASSNQAKRFARDALQGKFPEWPPYAIKQIAKEQKRRPGYIYLAYSETNHYKIGKSTGPEDRIEVFDTQMPVEVSLLHTFEADDMNSAETKLHDQYADKRVRGEWFELDQGDIEAIKAIDSYSNGVFVP